MNIVFGMARLSPLHQSREIGSLLLLELCTVPRLSAPQCLWSTNIKCKTKCSDLGHKGRRMKHACTRVATVLTRREDFVQGLNNCNKHCQKAFCIINMD